MVEKLRDALLDYLKFAFGAMLLATSAVFLYSSTATQSSDHNGTVIETIASLVMVVVATKILTGYLTLRSEPAAPRLGLIKLMFLSVASVFFSVALLQRLLFAWTRPRRGEEGRAAELNS
jgi:hypothetical protein